MQDYEYLFSKELHRRLKEKVKGKVWVKAYRDELHVTITAFEGELEYEFVEDDLSNKILNGFSSDYAVYTIMKDYHKFVNEIFFK